MRVTEQSDLQQENSELRQEVRELKARPAVKYAGAWHPEQQYHANEFITFQGSLWHVNADTIGVRPGTSPAFTLAIKRGKDGRSAS